jgi:hypothetical protein
MNKQDLEILMNMMPARSGQAPKAPPEYAQRLLDEVCSSTGLDWKKRHVYLMERGGKWMVTLSIDGFRTVAARNPDYGGQEGPFWTTAQDKPWSDIPPDGPVYAAKVGVKHKSGNVTWGVAKFKDYKAGPMWDKFPSTMAAKCAEMLALRKAMPEALGGLYGIEEMAQADKGVVYPSDGKGGAAKAEAPARIDNPLSVYKARIDSAVSLEILKAIGKEISASDLLELEDKLQLHETYNAKKGSF